MTFGQKRAALRTFHRVATDVRTRVNNSVMEEIETLTFTIPAADFDRCEWAMQYVKTWIPDTDAEGNLLRTGHYARLNMLFCRGSLSPTHFLLKNCPVFRGA